MNDTLIRSIRACSAALEQLAAALEKQSASRPTRMSMETEAALRRIKEVGKTRKP